MHRFQSEDKHVLVHLSLGVGGQIDTNGATGTDVRHAHNHRGKARITSAVPEDGAIGDLLFHPTERASIVRNRAQPNSEVGSGRVQPAVGRHARNVIRHHFQLSFVLPTEPSKRSRVSRCSVWRTRIEQARSRHLKRLKHSLRQELVPCQSARVANQLSQQEEVGVRVRH